MSIQDMAAALAARDAGMQSSAEHAEDVQPGWGGRAYQAVIACESLADDDGGWTMEFARGWLYACGLDMPAEERAWGSVTQRLLRDGRIIPVGYAPATTSNGSPKRTYKINRRGNV